MLWVTKSVLEFAGRDSSKGGLFRHLCLESLTCFSATKSCEWLVDWRFGFCIVSGRSRIWLVIFFFQHLASDYLGRQSWNRQFWPYFSRPSPSVSVRFFEQLPFHYFAILWDRRLRTAWRVNCRGKHWGFVVGVVAMFLVRILLWSWPCLFHLCSHLLQNFSLWTQTSHVYGNKFLQGVKKEGNRNPLRLVLTSYVLW